MPHDPSDYRDLAERSWAWAQTRVQSGDDGLWLPEKPDESEPGEYAYGMHSGIGGLAHLLAEIRLTRELTADERALADGIAETLVRRIADETEFDYFDGLVSTIGVLTALGAPGADLAVARLLELATPDGWQPSFLEPVRYVPEGRCNDVTLGNAAVLRRRPLGAPVRRAGRGRARRPGGGRRPGREGGAADRPELAVRAAALHAPAEGRDAELVARPGRYRRLPRRGRSRPGPAGADRGGPPRRRAPGHDRRHQRRRDADRRTSIPGHEDLDTYTYTWCHGPAGTSLLFAALDHAGVDTVGDRATYDWERACLHSLKVSGIPERVYPGFWDNDGRCCGTAGVGDVVLNVWQRHGEDDDLAFAVTLGDAIVDRAITDGDHVYWRFVEHRNADPLLPPGPGWMQGAAGIAAYLFRLARVLEQGRDAEAVARMDTWWALP